MAIVAGFTLQSFDSFFRDAQHDSRRLCGELKHNVVALAKAAKALKLPIVVTTTARDSMWGPTFPELVDALTGIEIIDRSSVNAFDDTRVARAIEATGRKKLIFAGISLEVCAAFPAITAVGKGSTPMQRSTLQEHSARPSGRLGIRGRPFGRAHSALFAQTNLLLSC